MRPGDGGAGAGHSGGASNRWRRQPGLGGRFRGLGGPVEARGGRAAAAARGEGAVGQAAGGGGGAAGGSGGRGEGGRGGRRAAAGSAAGAAARAGRGRRQQRRAAAAAAATQGPAPPRSRPGSNATGSGPHKVTVETNADPGIKEGTIFRPTDLGGAEKYPIFVWGEGGVLEGRAVERDGDGRARLARILRRRGRDAEWHRQSRERPFEAEGDGRAARRVRRLGDRRERQAVQRLLREPRHDARSPRTDFHAAD